MTHNVRLTTEDIKSILFAITIAEDEGYGPEEFGKGNWDELTEILNNALNDEDREEEVIDEKGEVVVEEEEAKEVDNSTQPNKKTAEPFSECMAHFTYISENTDAVRDVISRQKNGEQILVVCNPNNDRSNCIDLRDVAGIVNWFHIFEDVDDVLVGFKILNTPMGNKVKEYLDWLRNKYTLEQNLVVGIPTPSIAPIYYDSGRITGLQVFLEEPSTD